jgi:hypothetical protein
VVHPSECLFFFDAMIFLWRFTQQPDLIHPRVCRLSLRLFASAAKTAKGAVPTSQRTQRVPVAKEPTQNPYAEYAKAMYHMTQGNCPTEKIQNIGAQWKALPTEEKETWARKAAELVLPKASQAPKLRLGYHVFLRERLRAFGGSISHVAAEWKAAGPDVKEEYAWRAAELNASGFTPPKRATLAYHVFLRVHLEAFGGRTSLAAAEWKAVGPDIKEEYARRAAELNLSPSSPPRLRFPNGMSLFFKANFSKAPPGNQLERMRQTAAQWSSLHSEDKAVWARKAAALREAAGSKFIQFAGERGLGRQVKADSRPTRPNSVSLFIKEKFREAPPGNPTEKMRHLAAEWNALSNEEKASWAQKAAELSEATLQMAPKKPKLSTGYRVFLREHQPVSRLLGSQMQREKAAEWKALGPEVRRRYAQQAAELNASVNVTPRSKPNPLSLFLKEKLPGVPAGTPQDRMRFVALQWTALSSEEKAVWTQKAVDLLHKTIPNEDPSSRLNVKNPARRSHS